MNEKEKDEIKLLILLIVIVIATILVMFVAMNVGNLGVFFGNNILTNSSKTNYKNTSIITRIDSSGNLTNNNEIYDVSLEQNKMINIAGTSILTTKVKNNGTDKDNLRFKVKFIAYDKSILAEVMGYVGKIKANEIKYIDSYISKDISSLKDITYEIVK
jgi:hypothetical protein